MAFQPIDWCHLEDATLGDKQLADEVLDLFVVQSEALALMLAELPPHAPVLVHKLKGSARGIGAWRVAHAAENLETALSDCAGSDLAIATLLMHIADANEVIRAHTQHA